MQAAEAKLLAQMEAIKVRVQARDKNEKRHKHEAKQKARVRAAQMALGERCHRGPWSFAGSKQSVITSPHEDTESQEAIQTLFLGQDNCIHLVCGDSSVQPHLLS